MRAAIYANLNNFINILIIVLGCVIGFTNIISSDNISIISSIMGFCISLFKVLQDMFKFPSRSILLKSSFLKLKKLCKSAERHVLFLSQEDVKTSIGYLNTLYKQKENIEMEVFRTLIISSEQSIGETKDPNEIEDTSTSQ